ncbi:MAG: nuclear transport factor 2 family protein [Pseudomonadota bacterium]
METLMMIQHRMLATAAVTLLTGLLTLGIHADPETDEESIHRLLDDFHAAAAAADKQRYLDHFADNGVFMGTDDWERWPLDDFRQYVAQRFEGGVGWSYRSEDRYVAFADGNTTAWFDEIMVSERWGRFRGTGVLVRQGDEWKIAHYSLTILIPNESFAPISELATSGFEARASSAPDSGS